MNFLSMNGEEMMIKMINIAGHINVRVIGNLLSME